MAQILLIQIRREGDPMAAHERDCVSRRLAPRPVSLVSRNAFENLAEVSWLEGRDAVIIGGSGAFSVNHPLSQRWVPSLARLVERILARGLPAFGICFGHQLLGQVLGSTVATDVACAEAGTVEVGLTAEGMRDSVFAPCGSSFEVQTGHSDSVMAVPHGVVLMAENRTLQTQAFKVDGCPFYSTQFHPDLTGAEAHARYLAYQGALSGCVSPETLESVYCPESVGGAGLLGRFVAQVVRDKS